MVKSSVVANALAILECFLGRAPYSFTVPCSHHAFAALKCCVRLCIVIHFINYKHWNQIALYSPSRRIGGSICVLIGSANLHTTISSNTWDTYLFVQIICDLSNNASILSMIIISNLLNFGNSHPIKALHISNEFWLLDLLDRLRSANKCSRAIWPPYSTKTR